MTLDEFVQQGFQDHSTETEAVFARLADGIALVTEAKHLPQLAHLICHVCGEHLGRWDAGLELLERLTALPVFDANDPTGKAVLRQQAVLHRCAGRSEDEARCFAASRNADLPEASDRIRLLAIASTAFSFHGRIDEARRDFEECVTLAEYGPGKDDPAARALAVTSHNLAVDYENKAELTDAERALMLRAAEISLRFWIVAGTWREHERAEYRLAMSHLKAGDAAGALSHANECLRIVEANGSDPGEAFFAHEAVGRAQLAAGDLAAARAARDAMAAILPAIADEGFRSFAAPELAKFEAMLPRAPKPRPEPSLLRSPWK